VDEIRSCNGRIGQCASLTIWFSDFVIRISDFIRHSSFVIRISFVIRSRTAGSFGFATAAHLILICSLTSCSVGPNYHSPETKVPTTWSGAGEKGATNGPAQLAEWWKSFRDPELDSLILRAAGSNYNLKAAEARVKAARALRGAALADFAPNVDLAASYTKARLSKNALNVTPKVFDTDTYQANFDATWEIDVFGGKRRALEAANASLAAIIEDQRDVLVSLLAEVARNYIEARNYQERLVIAQKNLEAQREAVNIAQLRFKAGLASELDVSQATALLAATHAQVPALESSLREAMYHLAVLLGQAPGTLLTELSRPASLALSPPEVPAGLPSDLLKRRPDVRRSERQLAAATAQIGVATAELFPKFALTGGTAGAVAGYESLHAGNLVNGASKFWDVGPTVTWRLLEYPRLRAEIRSQTAQQEQALAQYYQAVLSALEDVENALVAYGKEQERQGSLRDSVQSSRRALELANQLYTQGLGEFLNVLDAERTLYQAEDQLAQSEQNVSINLVALYKALGGGWEAELKRN